MIKRIVQANVQQPNIQSKHDLFFIVLEKQDEHYGTQLQICSIHTC